MWQNATVRSMENALVLYLICFVLGSVGGLVASLGLRWGISRRCYKLEMDAIDLRLMLASLKGKTAADARWDKSKRADLELAELQQAPRPKQTKFSNDSFGSDEIYGLPR